MELGTTLQRVLAPRRGGTEPRGAVQDGGTEIVAVPKAPSLSPGVLAGGTVPGKGGGHPDPAASPLPVPLTPSWGEAALLVALEPPLSAASTISGLAVPSRGCSCQDEQLRPPGPGWDGARTGLCGFCGPCTAPSPPCRRVGQNPAPINAPGTVGTPKCPAQPRASIPALTALLGRARRAQGLWALPAAQGTGTGLSAAPGARTQRKGMT